MNQLTRLKDFQTVLRDYRLSEQAKSLLQRTKLVLLVGPSSSGRNTIINELLKSGKYHYIVSDTTRQPRANNGVMEENGREYWFREEADILHDLEDGEFLEAAIIHEQQVSGISMRELATAAEENKIAVNEIEVVGANNIHIAKPDALFIFVIPPSFNEWMARIQLRGALPPEEIRRRLNSAVDEITVALDRDYYHFVVNDTFMDTAQSIDAMSHGELQDPAMQERARSVARQLLEDTHSHLAKAAESTRLP